MGVNADDLGPGGANEPLQFVDLESRHAELRMHTGRLYMFMVPASLSRIDADKQATARE